jgi:hypothetical protein
LNTEWIAQNIHVHPDPNGEVGFRSEGAYRIQVDGRIIAEGRQWYRDNITASLATGIDMPEGIVISVSDMDVAGLLPEILDRGIEVSPEHVRLDRRYLLTRLRVLPGDDMPIRDEVVLLSPPPNEPCRGAERLCIGALFERHGR